MTRSRPTGFGNTTIQTQHSSGEDHSLKLRQDALHAIRSGKLGQAEIAYRKIIALGKCIASDFSNLAAIRLSKGDATEAVPLLENSLRLDNSNPEAWLNLGTALHRKGDLQGAERALRQAISLRPAFAKAHANLGNTLQGLQDFDGALDAYAQALALQPDYPDVLSNRGYALIERGQARDALDSIQRALQLRPDHADAHNNLGLALRDLGQLDAALDAHRRALALQPDSADVLSNIGVAEMERGQIAAAIEAFEQALAVEPHHPLSHRHLALCLNARRHPEALERSRASLAANSAHPERFHLHFAVGKYLLDVDAPEAIAELMVANRLRKERSSLAWSLPDVDQILQEQQQRLAGWLPQRLNQPGPEQERPTPGPTLIFIVGLPRCGSTLVETILSQSVGVVDLGEAPLLEQMIAAADNNPSSPAALAELEPLYRRLAAEHRPASAEPGTAALTDKYLYNFVHCQLIAAALPDSRIIHVYRNPMDNLLSLFSNHFAQGNAWTYDLDDAVAYYDVYRRLMAAHEQAMPGRLFHLSYDDLTRDPEHVLRPLLSHCGLPWDATCLNPHTSQRAIQTASAVQARQPIHSGSVGRWQRHAKALAPWAERLEQLGYDTTIPPLTHNAAPRR